MTTTYFDVILHLRPGAQVALVGGEAYENIDWGQEVPIAKADLDAALPTLTLARAKTAKRKQINAARDAAENAGFDYLGKRFDSDAQAINRLYGAAMAAQAAITSGTPASNVMETWTTADNSTVAITYQQAANFPVVMAQAASALHAKARTLKAQIDAATTLAEVEAVKW